MKVNELNSRIRTNEFYLKESNNLIKCSNKCICCWAPFMIGSIIIIIILSTYVNNYQNSLVKCYSVNCMIINRTVIDYPCENYLQNNCSDVLFTIKEWNTLSILNYTGVYNLLHGFELFDYLRDNPLGKNIDCYIIYDENNTITLNQDCSDWKEISEIQFSINFGYILTSILLLISIIAIITFLYQRNTNIASVKIYKSRLVNLEKQLKLKQTQKV